MIGPSYRRLDPYKSGRFRRHKRRVIAAQRRFSNSLLNHWWGPTLTDRYINRIINGPSKHEKRRLMRRPGESTETPTNGNGPATGFGAGTTVQFNGWKRSGPDSGNGAK